MSTKTIVVVYTIIVSLFVTTIFSMILFVLITVLNGTSNMVRPSTESVEQTTKTSITTTATTASSTSNMTTVTSSKPSTTSSTSTSSEAQGTTKKTSLLPSSPPTPSFERSAPVISRDDLRYDSFNTVTRLFEDVLNTTVNPCKDFYAFVCSAMPPTRRSASTYATTNNVILIHKKINQKAYREGTTSTALRKLFVEYDKCVRSDLKENKTYFRRQFRDLQRESRLEFPFRTQRPMVAGITAEKLAKAIGFIRSRSSVQTLLSIRVERNWRAPQYKRGYLLYVDQSNLLEDVEFYRTAWNTNRASLIRDFMDILDKTVIGLRIKDIRRDKIKATATELADFEHTLATTILTGEAERRQYERFYNVFTVEMANKTLPLFGWKSYFDQISRSVPNVQRKLLSPDFKFIIMEPAVITNLLNKIYDGTFSNELIANYLYVRFSQPFLKYVPDDANHRFTVYDALKEAMLRRQEDSILTRTFWKQKLLSENQVFGFLCGMVTAFAIPYANARVFIDAYSENSTTKDYFRADFAKYVSSIVGGFRGQINGLTWMSSETKKEAYDKIDNLVKNIGYPDFVTNDTLLDAYYADLDIDMDGGQTYIMREEAWHQFDMKKMLDRLLITTVSKRDDFAGPTSIANAWYQLDVNALTLPLGSLVEPLYNPNYPVAMNFGAIGVIVGHELTHGFDNEGIQWNSIGQLIKWMDNGSHALLNVCLYSSRLLKQSAQCSMKHSITIKSTA